MEFTVKNGECSIGSVTILSMSVSSVLMVGDLARVHLVSCLESPLEAPSNDQGSASDGD